MINNQYKKFIVSGALLVGVITFVSCNVTGGLENSDSTEEIIEFAKAKIDTTNPTECREAYEKLESLGTSASNEVHQLKGWARLCEAGASMAKVGATIFGFNASSPNKFEVIGVLANQLVPQTDESLSRIEQAITSFGLMSNGNEKSLSQALGQLIKATAIISRQTGDNVKVRRADIAPSTSCLNQTCSGAPATCDGGMSNADAVNFAVAVSSAATIIGNVSELGNVGTLASQLNGILSTSAARYTRCSIYNQMLNE